MKKAIHWLDENLEECILMLLLIGMTLIMGIQVFSRYALGMSLSWSEELTRYLFIWCGFISVSYCSKKCLSIKIEQFVALFPRRGKAIFKVINHTFELIFFLYMIPYAWSYMMSAVAGRYPLPAPSLCIIYRQHPLCHSSWLLSASCSAGSLNSAFPEEKTYLTLLTRNETLRNHLFRPMQTPILQQIQASTTVSVTSKTQVRRSRKCQSHYYLSSL